MQVLKRKSFYVLAVALILCLVMAFVPFTSKTALAEITDPAIAEGFTVKGAFIQMELGTEDNPDSGKFSLTFVADVTEDAYNTAAAQGELKIGLLVGRKSWLSNLTSNPDMTAATTEYGFYALSNVGSANSGASQQIMFTDGVAEITAGIVFDESKLPEGKLQNAAKLNLVAVPYVTYVGNVEDASDDVSYIYTANAVDRSAAPIINECYIRSSNFDYEKYADDANKPIVVTADMQNKFVVDMADSSKYVEVEGEYYYDTKYNSIQMADATTNALNHKNVLVAEDLSFGWAFNTHKSYIGGVYYPGGTSQVWKTDNTISGGLGNLNLDHLICSDKYTYGFSIFRDSDGALVNFKLKAATMIIKQMNAGGTNNYESLTGLYNGSAFNSPFGNSTASADDRNLQQTIDGLYVLGNDIKVLSTPRRAFNANGITHGKNTTYAGDKDLINDGTKGFVGTFDGRGFGIYDGPRNGMVNTNSASGCSAYVVSSNGCGLFTWINGGTVKNVSFFNLTLASVARNGSILAHAITGNSTIENVYIKPLTYSWNYDQVLSQSYEQGQILAKKIENSTLRNVIVEADFFDNNDGTIVEGYNHYEVLPETANGNTYENVISLGNTPVTYDAHKQTRTLVMTVNELPVIDAEGTIATAGETYVLADYPVLSEAYGEYAHNIIDDCRGQFNDSEYPGEFTIDEISITFNLNANGVKQFSGYRDLAAYVNNVENEAVKTALVNSDFYNVAESGFVTPAHIPTTNVAKNMLVDGYTYGNRVDDAIVVVFGRYNNASTPLYYGDCYGVEMVMANEEGKFIVDFSKYTSLLGATGRVWVLYNNADQSGASQETLLTYEDCATATAVEVPAHDVVFQRISRT